MLHKLKNARDKVIGGRFPTLLECLNYQFPNTNGHLPLVELCAAIDEAINTKSTCSWKRWEGGQYETQCGEVFEFTNDGIKENSAVYCQYCGAMIVEVPYREPEIDHEAEMGERERDLQIERDAQRRDDRG